MASDSSRGSAPGQPPISPVGPVVSFVTMSDVATAAAVRNSRRGAVGYVNRRARLLGGGSFLLMGLVLFVSALASPSVGSLSVFVLLGLLTLAIGARMTLACALYVDPPNLELRFVYRTRRIPLTQIARCETRLDARGLLYRRIYPTFILKDGREVPFNFVQWSTDDPDVAEAACRQLTLNLSAMS